MVGEITTTTPVFCKDITAVEVALEGLVLAAATDFIHVLPQGIGTGWWVFKSERASA